MSVCPEIPEELKFPVLVHLKIIAEISEDLRAHLEIALCELAIHDDLVPGRSSAAGKYMTYNLSTVAHSQDHLREIDARLRAVDGVRMVL